MGSLSSYGEFWVPFGQEWVLQTFFGKMGSEHSDYSAMYARQRNECLFGYAAVRSSSTAVPLGHAGDTFDG